MVYGLGAENQNLPGFIVLGGGGDTSKFGSAFLPSVYQGTSINLKEKDPKKQIEYLNNPKLNMPQQRDHLEHLQDPEGPTDPAPPRRSAADRAHQCAAW